MARYRIEGQAAFELRSRRPHSSPNAVNGQVIDLIVRLRKELTEQGLDAGPDTLVWHLQHHHRVKVSRVTIWRILTRQGLIVAEPKKKPKSAYIRFQAELPNERWQADFTHHRLADGTDTEILTFIDDHSRMALSVTAHRRVTGPIVLTEFRETVAAYGIPASTLTDNGMVFTTRLAGGKGGRNGFETELRHLGVRQINSAPNHPTTCGKVERFQQTLKKWLRAQHRKPASLTELQTLIDSFVDEYNHRRPHRSLPHHAVPTVAYTTRPKAAPGNRDTDHHDRVRTDIVDKAGSVTLRHNGKPHHIGIGRTHTRTRVLLLVQDLNITIINAQTGELLRELTLNPHRDYQPATQKMA